MTEVTSDDRLDVYSWHNLQMQETRTLYLPEKFTYKYNI
jgi:hypothetical protein